MAYTVTAPLVVVQDEQGSYHHIYQGAPLPKFVSDEDAERLAEGGLIEQDDAERGEQQSRPAKAASKAEWVAFAVAQGMSEEDAEAATKDDLVSAFGD